MKKSILRKIALIFVLIFIIGNIKNEVKAYDADSYGSKGIPCSIHTDCWVHTIIGKVNGVKAAKEVHMNRHGNKPVATASNYGMICVDHDNNNTDDNGDNSKILYRIVLKNAMIQSFDKFNSNGTVTNVFSGWGYKKAAKMAYILASTGHYVKDITDWTTSSNDTRTLAI